MANNPVPLLRVNVTQTVTAAAYSSGNAVGGLITFANAAPNWGTGWVESVIVRDKAGQTSTYELFLFDSNPSTTTVTDKAAVAINTADLAKCIGVVTLPAVKLGAAATMAVATTAVPAGLAFSLGLGVTTMYGILVTRSTPTYASTSDVTVTLLTNPGS
jgi:hypothetical protein